MIQYTEIKNDDNKTCHFIHDNGFPTLSYKSLLESISQRYSVKSVLLRPFWDNSSIPSTLKNWDIFFHDLKKYNKENNVNSQYCIVHSIGGNLLLRLSLDNRETYKSIILYILF